MWKQHHGGKLAWRRSLPPGTVTEVDRSGRKCSVRRDDGVVLKSIHLENIVELPDDVVDWEVRVRPELDPDSGGGAPRDRVDLRRSPGQLLGARPPSEPLAAQKARVKGLQVGVHIAYASEGPRRMRVGRVLELCEMERVAIAHRFAARCDQRLSG